MSRVNRTFPFQADLIPDKMKVCGREDVDGVVSSVGQQDVVYFEITYFADVDKARQTQQDMMAKGENQKAIFKGDFYKANPWFSSDDFDDLLQRLELNYAKFNVCLRANPGGYFSFSCPGGSGGTQPPVVLPLVEVTEYKSGVLLEKDNIETEILSFMDRRWGGAFCIMPGPLGKAQT